jgi:hypothetical protein
MNIKAKILGAAMGALGLCGLGTAALAGSTTPPGERAGIDLASPLPEGIYFVNITGVGNWRDGPSNGNSGFDYNVPIIAWATPWQLLGGRFQVIAAAPEAAAGFNHANNTKGGPAALALGNGGYLRGMYNPFIAGQFAWNLGNGFSVSVLSGAYIAISGGDFGNLYDRTTWSSQLALAYHQNGWNATANLIVGIVGNQQGGNCSITSCTNNDAFNYDLGLTHTFGKWEIGVVGYGSTDFGGYGAGFGSTGIFHAAYQNQSQFALGGLVGYNFGPVITQFSLTTDVYKHNYNAYQTQFHSVVIVPLWNPEVPKAVVAKY